MNKLKKLRTEAGLSTRELSEQLGMKSHSMINRIERGQTAGLKFSTIKKICEYFDVTPNYLLGYEDSENLVTEIDDRAEENSKEKDRLILKLSKELDAYKKAYFDLVDVLRAKERL